MMLCSQQYATLAVIFAAVAAACIWTVKPLCGEVSKLAR
jgi:hypothetical protein